MRETVDEIALPRQRDGLGVVLLQHGVQRLLGNRPLLAQLPVALDFGRGQRLQLLLVGKHLALLGAGALECLQVRLGLGQLRLPTPQ